MPGKEGLDPAIPILHPRLREWEAIRGHLLLQGIDCMADKHTMQVVAQPGNGFPWPATA